MDKSHVAKIGNKEYQIYKFGWQFFFLETFHIQVYPFLK